MLVCNQHLNFSFFLESLTPLELIKIARFFGVCHLPMQINSCMACLVMTLPLLLIFSQTGSMLSLKIANILPLRQEVTANLIQITIEEDNIAFQLSLPVPNINIICASINSTVTLKQRNQRILDFLDQYAG